MLQPSIVASEAKQGWVTAIAALQPLIFFLVYPSGI